MKALRRFLPLLVAAATVAAFLPALGNGFVNWDDPANFLDNPHFRGFSAANLKWMFTAFHMGHYHPLTWLSLAADYTVWGMNPFGYHLTNVLLHAANAVLFYFVAGILFRKVFGATRPLRRLACAAAAALLFSVHPLRVESVAWATERRDLLSGLFYLATILAYLRARIGWSLAFYALSLFSKGSGVGLPFVLLALDFHPLRRRALVEKIPYFVLAGGVGLLAMSAGSQASKIMTLAEMGPASRLAQVMYGYAFYLWKTVLPWGLVPLYHRPLAMSPLSSPYLPMGLAVAALTCAAFHFRKRLPAFTAAWAAYAVILAPLSGVVTNGPQIAADRYTYLACMGFPLLAAAPFIKAGRRAWLSLVAVIIVLGALTWRQNYLWRDSETLWRETYARNPLSTLAQTNLASTLYNKGVALTNEGKIEEAGRAYIEALRAYPGHWQAHNNLGNVYLKLGRPAEAAAEYELAYKLKPDLPALAAARDYALKAARR